MTTICFLGVGHMGGGMAATLARAGFDVRVFDPYAEIRRDANSSEALTPGDPAWAR